MTWALEALDQSYSHLTASPRGGVRDGGLRADLADLQAELRRQHELTDLEGYEEHPVGEPLRLKSQYWQIGVNTTTGNAATGLAREKKIAHLVSFRIFFLFVRGSCIFVRASYPFP